MLLSYENRNKTESEVEERATESKLLITVIFILLSDVKTTNSGKCHGNSVQRYSG